MKAFLFFIAFSVYQSVSGQTVSSIDTLVQRVNSTTYSDSVVVKHDVHSSTGLSQITGYLSGDTLMKTISLFANSTRKRFTYYRCEADWAINRPRYVTELDSLTQNQLTSVYGYDNSISNYTVLKYEIKNPSDSVYLKYPARLLEDADYSIELANALIDKKSEKYHFKVRLVKDLPLPPGCGRIAFGLLQKFEVLATDFPNYDKKFVLLVQPCPDFLGNRFFRKGKTYEVEAATNSGVAWGDYSYNNEYKKEDLPKFWIRNITRPN